MGNTIHETRRKKNGALMRGRLHIKTTQIPPFFCNIPVFRSLLSLYIPLSFTNFSHLRKKFAGLRIIVLFLFVFIYFLIFVCSKGHPSSNSGPSKENFMKRVQIQDDEEAKSQGDGERRNKKLREQALCELSHVISRIFIHTVRKGNFVTKD